LHFARIKIPEKREAANVIWFSQKNSSKTIATARVKTQAVTQVILVCALPLPTSLVLAVV